MKCKTIDDLINYYFFAASASSCFKFKLDEIINKYSNQSINNNIILTMQNMIDKELIDVIENDMTEEEKSIMLMNYINFNLHAENKPINEFNKLAVLLDNIKYYPSSDVITEIIKTDNNLTKLILRFIKNKKLTYEFFESQSINSSILEFITTFCFEKGIIIYGEDIDLEEEERYLNELEVNNPMAILFRDMRKYPILSREEQLELAKIKDIDPKAKEKLINHNLRLVVSIARKIQKKTTSMDFLDLFQEGTIGLMKAIDKFDPSKGFTIPTYASYQIRQSIHRSIDEKGKMIRIPTHLNEKLGLIQKTIKDLQNLYGREPSVEEVADFLGIETESIEKVFVYCLGVTSLNKPVIINEEETELGEFIPSDYDLQLEIESSDLEYDIDYVFNKLKFNNQQKYILIHYYGLHGNEPQSLETIGKHYNVTRERIRQIKKKCLLRILKSKYGKVLKDYLQSGDALSNQNNYLKDLNRTEKRVRMKKTDEVKKRNNNELEITDQDVYTDFKFLMLSYSPFSVDEIVYSINEIRKSLMIPVTHDVKKIYEFAIANETALRNYLAINFKNKEFEKPIPEKNTGLSFEYYLKSRSIKEITILSLKYGIGFSKEYTYDEIAQFLQMDKSEVMNIVKTVLSDMNDELSRIYQRVNFYSVQEKNNIL